jgi:hypothetical protein
MPQRLEDDLFARIPKTIRALPTERETSSVSK